jgi:hypothetical protein
MLCRQHVLPRNACMLGSPGAAGSQRTRGSWCPTAPVPIRAAETASLKPVFRLSPWRFLLDPPWRPQERRRRVFGNPDAPEVSRQWERGSCFRVRGIHVKRAQVRFEEDTVDPPIAGPPPASMSSPICFLWLASLTSQLSRPTSSPPSTLPVTSSWNPLDPLVLDTSASRS